MSGIVFDNGNTSWDKHDTTIQLALKTGASGGLPPYSYKATCSDNHVSDLSVDDKSLSFKLTGFNGSGDNPAINTEIDVVTTDSKGATASSKCAVSVPEDNLTPPPPPPPPPKPMMVWSGSCPVWGFREPPTSFTSPTFGGQSYLFKITCGTQSAQYTSSADEYVFIQGEYDNDGEYSVGIFRQGTHYPINNLQLTDNPPVPSGEIWTNP